MFCLITTSRAVLTLDTDSHRIKILHEGYGLYYGICRHNGHIAVAARRRLSSNQDEIESERGCIILIDIRRLEINILEPEIPLRDLHGIASIEGKLWCTCSYDNGIALLSRNSSSMVYPLGRSNLPPFDVNHINTVKKIGRKIYIVAHNKGKSQVHVLDSKSFQVVETFDLGMYAHDVWCDGTELRVCSSGESDIVGTDGFRKKIGGFPRGHVQNSSTHIIGVTEHKLRKDRDESNSKIIITNNEYIILDKIELLGFGMVLDILQLNKEEFRNLFYIPLKMKLSKES